MVPSTLCRNVARPRARVNCRSQRTRGHSAPRTVANTKRSPDKPQANKLTRARSASYERPRMTSWGRRVLRGLGAVVRAMAFLLAAGVVVAVASLWYVVHAPDLPTLRSVLARLQEAISGQAISSLDLEARVELPATTLSATAAVQVRFDRPDKRVVYFLLDPGFEIVQITSELGKEQPSSLPWLRLGPLVQVWRGQVGHEQSFRIAYRGTPSLRPSDCRVRTDEVLLPPDCLWYPLDAQGFFSARVRVRLPASWQFVENTSATEVAPRGQWNEYFWQSERLLAGFGLIAGRYRVQERWDGGVRWRVYAPQGDRTNLEAVVTTAQKAYAALLGRFGSPGFSQFSFVLHPELSRAFHDGSGVMAVPRRALSSEDEGFALFAHELAHSWWGATVTGGWLRTATGAQWIIEGFAELASLLATESEYGSAALAKRLVSEFYDPEEQQALIDMTVLDNALPQARARETIYRKGSYVLWMLKNIVGDDAFFSGLRELIQTHWNREVTAAAVQETFERVSQQSLEDFFAAFVRGRATVDFSIDPAGPNRLSVAQVGSASWKWPVTVLVRRGDGTDERRLQVTLPTELPVEAGDHEIIVDPFLEWADLSRSNNRYPRHDDPLWVAAASDGRMTVRGEPFPWSRVRVDWQQVSNSVERKEWEFPRGLAGAPVYDPDHNWFITNVANTSGKLPEIVILEADGSRRLLGRGCSPIPAEHGAVLAAAGSRILRFGPSGRTQTVLDQPGKTIEALVPLPEPERLAFVASDGARSTLFLFDRETAELMPIWAWERALPFVAWSAAEDAFVVGLANGSSWEVWLVPTRENPPRILVANAAMLSDLALDPDGRKIALVAAAERQYPETKRAVFVLDLQDRTVKSWPSDTFDFLRVNWETNDSVLAIARAVPSSGSPVVYPWRRAAFRLRLGSDRPEPLE